MKRQKTKINNYMNNVIKYLAMIYMKLKMINLILWISNSLFYHTMMINKVINWIYYLLKRVIKEEEEEFIHKIFKVVKVQIIKLDLYKIIIMN